ncbi:hypothetical protein ADUPG1_012417 [Aduncisulcus paluster]|uniref:Uncharacterized protein n=1 Tax=Aduncisulcus paluster TaxID=2918883 RepID=A0ABQ5K2Q5_9EUKA|nr:hypothetical protein ADUPG1_012417 [Aduncisulcus paluster]
MWHQMSMLSPWSSPFSIPCTLTLNADVVWSGFIEENAKKPGHYETSLTLPLVQGVYTFTVDSRTNVTDDLC